MVRQKEKLKTPKRNKSIKEGFLPIRVEGSIPSLAVKRYYP